MQASRVLSGLGYILRKECFWLVAWTDKGGGPGVGVSQSAKPESLLPTHWSKSSDSATDPFYSSVYIHYY